MPQFGISTYSLHKTLIDGRFTLLTGMAWIKGQGVDHLEVAKVEEFNRMNITVDSFLTQARELDLNLSCYSVSGDVVNKNLIERRREVARLKGEIDTAARLGLPYMRHDLGPWGIPEGEDSDELFELNLKVIAEAARELADYGEKQGVCCLVENHGLLVNGASRLLRLYEAVDRDNFGFILDIGNFLYVDEDPIESVKQLVPYTKLVHAKDLHVKQQVANSQKERYFETAGGSYLRGAVFGEGDLPITEILKVIKRAGFDGPITLEYEGEEDSVDGTARGLEHLRGMWAKA